MKYRSKVVWCLCLLLAGLAVVAVVPHIAHAATRCEACKGTGRDICEFCGGVGCAQCNFKGGKYSCYFGFCDYAKCRYCDGEGVIYTAAEKAAMEKKAESERAGQAMKAEMEQVRIKKAVQEARASIDTFTDNRDGKSYKKLTVGSQTWMGENLNYNAAGSKCYGNDENNCAKYGRLYDWNTAMKACPAGWYLPSQAEWNELTNYVGGWNTAGKKLKSTSGWYNNGNGTDQYGFSALPGGYVQSQSGGIFGDPGEGGRWWSATKSDDGSAWILYMQNNGNDTKMNAFNNRETSLFSVRCVQDISPEERAKMRAKMDQDVQSITLGRNKGSDYDNWQAFYRIPSSVRGNRITAGDTYTFTYSFKSNVAITGNLIIFLVDESATATPRKWWTVLSEYKVIKTGISFNTEISGTVTLNATQTVSSTEERANTLVFQINPASNAASEPTLFFSSFSLKLADAGRLEREAAEWEEKWKKLEAERQEKLEAERQAELARQEAERKQAAQKYINWGIEYHTKGKFNDAIKWYNDALKLNPDADVQEYLEMAKKKKKLKLKR